MARINNFNEFLLRNINKECFKEILELSYEANTTSNIKNKEILLEKMIAKVKILDFLLNLCYDKMITNNRKYIKFGEKTNDIKIYNWLDKKYKSIGHSCMVGFENVK